MLVQVDILLGYLLFTALALMRFWFTMKGVQGTYAVATCRGKTR